MMIKRTTIILILICSQIGISTIIKFPKKNHQYPPYLTALNDKWVNEILDTLTLEEKIAQLIMVPAYSNKNISHQVEIEKLIKEYKIGGLIFFQGGPVRQLNLINNFQAKSTIPLLIAQDAEWGLSMRLDSTHSYPWAMTMGAVQNDTLIYDMASDLAKQCKRMGIHINFAPVSDINSNPKNPIINARSFGEDKYNVARKSIQYLLGQQDYGILSCSKHFPGHGDTDSDSHKTLPYINHDKERIETTELYPFIEVVQNGIGSIMVAHLEVPSLENKEGVPSSLSREIVTELLKRKLGFQGLVVTDALNMSGITNYFDSNEAALQAFLAGNDILLMPKDVEQVISLIKNKIIKDRNLKKQLDFSCRKILALKYWNNLDQHKPISTENLYNDINSNSSRLINRSIIADALTIIKNDNILPINSHYNKIAYVEIGDDSGEVFYNYLKYYANVKKIRYNVNNIDQTLAELQEFDIVILGIHKFTKSPWSSYSISRSTNHFVSRLAIQNTVIIDLFTNPYALADFPALADVEGIVMSYQNEDDFQSLSAQLIFGAIEGIGKLPISPSKKITIHNYLKTPKLNKISFALPEEVGVNSQEISLIDSIALEAIIDKATPGCQVLVLKNSNVIYYKSFGYFTYDKTRSVSNYSIYDLASLTKILATIPCLIYLQEEEKFDLDATLGDYLPNIAKDKYNLDFRQILAHQSGLKSWIPFYKEILDNNWVKHVLSNKVTLSHTIKVADNLYLHSSYIDTMFLRIDSSKVLDEKKYVYSDLGYYYLKLIIEDKLKEFVNTWLDSNFYSPIGAYSLGYLPLSNRDKSTIVPTEIDKEFRKQVVQGHVHDPGAAMLGGVGCHAGLFGSALDVAKIMQLFLQGGEYGQKQYLNKLIIQQYTECQFYENKNRRGIGFDKPQLEEAGPTCGCVSMKSFGHTGFTGTIAWADPQEEIVYVFLSNRIYPDPANRKLINKNVRTKIQQTIYNSLIQ